MTRVPQTATLVAGLLATVVFALRWGATAPVQMVHVKALEFAFEPKQITVRAGEVIFEVTNTGAIEHNFLVEDSAKRVAGKVAVIPPGQTEQVGVVLRAGAYTIYCDLPGHRDAGMVAGLQVQP